MPNEHYLFENVMNFTRHYYCCVQKYSSALKNVPYALIILLPLLCFQTHENIVGCTVYNLPYFLPPRKAIKLKRKADGRRYEVTVYDIPGVFSIFLKNRATKLEKTGSDVCCSAQTSVLLASLRIFMMYINPLPIKSMGWKTFCSGSN